jgi:hypothetical protein
MEKNGRLLQDKVKSEKRLIYAGVGVPLDTNRNNFHFCRKIT